jgi:hypothetical protein
MSELAGKQSRVQALDPVAGNAAGPAPGKQTLVDQLGPAGDVAAAQPAGDAPAAGANPLTPGQAAMAVSF